MVTIRRPTRRLVRTGVDVVALAEVTGTAAGQAVVGMTRATAVAHMMIDQADIVTEADSAATATVAAVAAVPTSSRYVADESIATTTGREKTRAGNGATKAATRIRVSSDATKPCDFLSRQESFLSWWVSSVFRTSASSRLFLLPFDTKGKQG
ncbi:hypothetical protein F5Y13DRAFT_143306 [Hypoxylon sp. FL1857]|nr:hypothetical protein F5Y13DRAFT_143306 [Hypoxylon sp. FL1857]